MIQAYMLIKTRHGKLKLTAAALNDFEEVVEVHEVFGQWDIILKVAFEDLPSLKEFIQNKIQITDGVHHSETLMCNDTKEFD